MLVINLHISGNLQLFGTSKKQPKTIPHHTLMPANPVSRSLLFIMFDQLFVRKGAIPGQNGDNATKQCSKSQIL